MKECLLFFVVVSIVIVPEGHERDARGACGAVLGRPSQGAQVKFVVVQEGYSAMNGKGSGADHGRGKVEV